MNKIYQKRLEGAAKKNVSAWIKAADYDTVKAKYIKGGEYILANLWISVEEALPTRSHFLDGEESDKSINVFVRYKNGAVTSAWYCYSSKVWYFAVGRKGDNSIHDEITHWMPIPELKGGAQ